MRRMTLVRSIAVLALFATVSRPVLVGACSCAPPAPAKEKLPEASAVFTGEVLSTGMPGCGQRYEVRVRVADVWKGELEKEVYVQNPRDSAACGVSLTAGESYLFIAYGERLGIGLCSAPRPLASASEEIAELGPPL